MYKYILKLRDGYLLASILDFEVMYAIELPTIVNPTPVQQVVVAPNNADKDGVDQNGLSVGYWKQGLLGCFDSCVPNGMQFCTKIV